MTSPQIEQEQQHGREATDTVARLIASILDAPPTPEEVDLPLALQQIARLRSATRRLLEANLEPGAEQEILGALGHQAHHAELAEWALEAIVGELPGPDVTLLPPPTFERGQQRMRRAGFEVCPVCCSPVLSEVTLSHLRHRRRWTEDDLERWKRVGS